MLQFCLSIIPLLIISVFFWIRKIKIKDFINVIFWGIIFIVITLLFNNIITIFAPRLEYLYNFGNNFSKFFAIFIIAGVIEELARFISLKASRPKSKTQIFTNLMYISLIFTIYEDYSYLGSSTYFLKLGLFRAITPCHLIFAVIMSFFLTKAYDSKNGQEKKKYLIYEILALIVPIILHTIFDYYVKDFNVVDLNIFLVIILFILSYGISIWSIFKCPKEEEISSPSSNNKIITILKIIFIVLFTLFYSFTFKTNYTKLQDSKEIIEEKIKITINNIEEIKVNETYTKVNITIENSNNKNYDFSVFDWNLIGYDELINAEYGYDGDTLPSKIEVNSKITLNLYFKTKYNDNYKLQYSNMVYDKEKGKIVNNKYLFLLK